MSISAVSSGFNDYLAAQATQMKGQQVHQEIQTAVLRELLDQQKAAGEAVLRLIQSAPTPSLTGAGTLIDRLA